MLTISIAGGAATSYEMRRNMVFGAAGTRAVMLTGMQTCSHVQRPEGRSHMVLQHDEPMWASGNRRQDVDRGRGVCSRPRTNMRGKVSPQRAAPWARCDRRSDAATNQVYRRSRSSARLAQADRVAPASPRRSRQNPAQAVNRQTLNVLRNDDDDGLLATRRAGTLARGRH